MEMVGKNVILLIGVFEDILFGCFNFLFLCYFRKGYNKGRFFIWYLRLYKYKKRRCKKCYDVIILFI